MKLLAAIAFAVALASPASAQINWREFGETLRTNSVRSLSRQFVVFSSRTPNLSRQRTLEIDRRMLSLEPTLLAISCERIKESFWRTLGAAPSWQGTVYLNLYSARTDNDPVIVMAKKVRDGWNYHVDLPDVLEQNRFVHVIVEVLLLEAANRHANSRSAEVPAWLAEGLSQELFMTGKREFILPPPRAMEISSGINVSRLNVSVRRTNSLVQVEEVLRVRPPLTFEQLSWPTDELLTGENGEVYRGSAQLFVNQLLNLPGGPASLRTMLDELPRYYNWQFAFLSGFRPWFQSALDVEKWWALQVVQFTGRDLMLTWQNDESAKKLDEIIRTSVEVRSTLNELPLRTDVSLQTILREWDALQQTQILQRKLQDLVLLRLHVAQNWVSLVDDYRQVIETYLRMRTSAPFLPFARRAVAPKAVEDAVRQLDELDALREGLRQQVPPATSMTAGPVEKPAAQ